MADAERRDTTRLRRFVEWVPQPPHWLSWYVGMASVVTFWLLAEKNWWGFVLCITNQFGWSWIAISKRQFGLLVSACFFLAVSARGLQNWL